MQITHNKKSHNIQISKNHKNIISSNKKIIYKYLVIKIFEAGVVLKGWEVKAIKSHKIDISNSYIKLKNGEAWLINSILHIESFKKDSRITSQRDKKLLLKNNELCNIKNILTKNRYTIVVLSVYSKKNLIKLEIAIVSGKKKYDKRSTIKQRQWLINKNRILKNYNKY